MHVYKFGDMTYLDVYQAALTRRGTLTHAYRSFSLKLEFCFRIFGVTYLSHAR
jgi:hypothetical protein